MNITNVDYISKNKRKLGRWVDLVGWIVFCAWVFAAAFLDFLPRGSGSLGLGVLVILVACVRKLLGYSISFFWLIIGGIFFAAGIGGFSGIDLPFTSFALIACGVLLLLHNRSKRHG